MPFRVGVDLVAVESVQESIETHGAHYLTRVYTEREVEDCTSAAGLDAQRLAARFAAKEATMKALGTGWACGIKFLDICVSNEFGGRPQVTLLGEAAQRACSLGVTRVHVSLSHERDQAVAFVVLEGAPTADPPPPQP